MKYAAKNQKGLSLIEVLITAGLMGVVTLGTVAIQKSGLMGQKTLQAKDDLRLILSEMSSILSDPTACTNTFAGVAPANGEAILLLKDKAGNTRFSINSVYGNRTLKLTGITVGGSGNDAQSNTPKWAVSSATAGTAFVQVSWQQTGSDGNKGTGPANLSRHFLIDVTLDANGKIASCTSQMGTNAASLGSGTESYIPMWASNSSLTNSIISQTDSRIGIGTTNPSSAFEVFSTNSAFLPPRLSTAQRDSIPSPVDGMVFYNTTTNKLTVRENGAWSEVGGGVNDGGLHGIVLKTSGTFRVPPGVTAIKVTLDGARGGNGSYDPGANGVDANGSYTQWCTSNYVATGGSPSTGLKYISGLTPGTDIPYTIGKKGTDAPLSGPGSGGNSSPTSFGTYMSTYSTGASYTWGNFCHNPIAGNNYSTGFDQTVGRMGFGGNDGSILIEY